MVPFTTIYFPGGDSLAEAQGFESLNPSIERCARPNKNLRVEPLLRNKDANLQIDRIS
jgi:hypothetical protein